MNRDYVFGKLFAEPSFVEGMARTVDIGNTLKEYNESGAECDPDTEALKNDWRAIGNDIRASILTYEQAQ